MGAHSERQVVYISGKISGADKLGELEEYLISKMPPRKLEFNLLMV